MGKIFLSYTRKDKYIDTILLSKIYEIISNKYSCYIDALHNDSKEKQTRVESELLNSDIMLLLCSSSINESSWVNREIEIANTHNIPIVGITFNEKDTHKKIESLINNILKISNKANNQINLTAMSYGLKNRPTLMASGY